MTSATSDWIKPRTATLLSVGAGGWAGTHVDNNDVYLPGIVCTTVAFIVIYEVPYNIIQLGDFHPTLNLQDLLQEICHRTNNLSYWVAVAAFDIDIFLSRISWRRLPKMGRISINNNTKKHNRDDPEKQASAQSGDATLSLSVKPKDRDESLTLEQYRELVGLPQEHNSPNSRNENVTGFVKTKHGLISLSSLNDQSSDRDHSPQLRKTTVTDKDSASYDPRSILTPKPFPRPATMRDKPKFWLRRRNAMEAEEYATSLYYNLLRLESDQHRLYHFYNILMYTCLILQLAIASVLIILGAILGGTSDSGRRVAIAVLAAATGVLTGVMSLAKGQGYPTRMVQYANRLRQVRDKLEFMERALRANCGAIVTFQDVLEIWNEFEQVRDEKAMNQPDVWTTFQQIERPLMRLEQKQMRRLGTRGATTGAGALPLFDLTEPHVSDNTAPPRSQNTTSRSQQHHSATSDATAEPTPTRGNTIRISNDGTRKETRP